MALFDTIGTAEVIFVCAVGVALLMVVICIIALCLRGRTITHVYEMKGICVTYEGEIIHVAIEDIIESGFGFDLLRRINVKLQLKSTYKDLAVFKQWDSPDTVARLDPHARITSFLSPEEVLQTKTLPLLVERERFNVTGAFPWLYPIVNRDSLVSHTPGVQLCYGIQVGARVRKLVSGEHTGFSMEKQTQRSYLSTAPNIPVGTEGVIQELDAQGMLRVLWDGYLLDRTVNPLEEGGGEAGGSEAGRTGTTAVVPVAAQTWEYWGKGGVFSVVPAAGWSAHPAQMHSTMRPMGQPVFAVQPATIVPSQFSSQQGDTSNAVPSSSTGASTADMRELTLRNTRATVESEPVSEQRRVVGAAAAAAAAGPPASGSSRLSSSTSSSSGSSSGSSSRSSSSSSSGSQTESGVPTSEGGSLLSDSTSATGSRRTASTSVAGSSLPSSRQSSRKTESIKTTSRGSRQSTRESSRQSLRQTSSRQTSSQLGPSERESSRQSTRQSSQLGSRRTDSGADHLQARK